MSFAQLSVVGWVWGRDGRVESEKGRSSITFPVLMHRIALSHHHVFTISFLHSDSFFLSLPRLFWVESYGQANTLLSHVPVPNKPSHFSEGKATCLQKCSFHSIPMYFLTSFAQLSVVGWEWGRGGQVESERGARRDVLQSLSLFSCTPCSFSSLRLCSAQQLKQQFRSTLDASQWRGPHRFNRAVVLVVVHSLLGHSGSRRVVKPTHFLPSHVLSLSQL